MAENTRIHILVVDDDRGILELVRRSLEHEGYQVDTIENSKAVLEQNLEWYQMIILDVMMPGMDGFSLCRELRDRVDCPILFLTAKSEESDLMKGLGAGGDDYITKPFGIGELRARVAAHLRREKRERKHFLEAGGVRFQIQAKKMFYQETEIPMTKSEYAICERENVDRYVFKIHRYILHQYRIDIYRRIYRTCTPVNDRSGTSGELCGTMA